MANEKRLIDLDLAIAKVKDDGLLGTGYSDSERIDDVCDMLESCPTVDAAPVVHGRWVLTAHEERTNYRWNVTAECSKCDHSKGEIYAGFFPDFPKNLARYVVLDCAKSVNLDNYCPNCGAKMDGDGDD